MKMPYKDNKKIIFCMKGEKWSISSMNLSLFNGNDLFVRTAI